MQQGPEIPRHLKLRFIHIDDRPSTADFQFVAQGMDGLPLQVNDVCCIQFAAFYKYENNLYKHPFILHTNSNGDPLFQFPEKGLYNIPLFLKLKRLRDFDQDDWKNYYRTIDENLETNANSPDFHDVYLKIYYCFNNTNQWDEYLCNDGLPIQLPTLLSNSWSKFDTVFRFRYDAEQRDGEFPCQMKLLLNDTMNLDSYKIVLCLTTNTIPARMDFHSIRWTCKLKPKATKRSRKSTNVGNGEQLYYLNHPCGVIVAEVSGSDLTFTPRISPGGIKSCYEPNGFIERLANSDIKDTDGLTIGVIKETKYSETVRMRRTDEKIRRYIPFKELNDMDDNLEGGDTEIKNRLKHYKRECYKPLILYDEPEKKSYSQAHVRLYAAIYDDNDVLCAETLYPPLRDTKKFEQIQILRIVQSTSELHSGATAFIYCTYDTDKFKSELSTSPYIVEFAFTTKCDKRDSDRLLKLFETQSINTPTSYVYKCTNLLQFQVPNVPMYHKHRVFIHLQHKSSLDYNPSAPALTNDEECWIYYADRSTITDNSVAAIFHETNNSRNNDEDYVNLNTPYFTLEALPGFSFSDQSSVLNDI